MRIRSLADSGLRSLWLALVPISVGAGLAVFPEMGTGLLAVLVVAALFIAVDSWLVSFMLAYAGLLVANAVPESSGAVFYLRFLGFGLLTLAAWTSPMRHVRLARNRLGAPPAQRMLSLPTISLTVLCLYATLSVGWSRSPSDTVSNSIALCLLVAAVLAAAVRRWRQPKRFLSDAKFMVGVLCITCLANLLTGIALPSFGYEQGRLRGFVGNANTLAMIFSLAFVASFAVWDLVRTHKPAYRVVLFGLAIGLLLTQSRTAILATGFATAAISLMARATPLRPVRVVAYSFCLPALVILAAQWAATLSVGRRFGGTGLGRLSGRLDVWRAATEAFLEAPIVGSGYRATGVVLERIGIESDQTYNGFLKVGVDLGVIGLLLLLVSLLVPTLAAVRVDSRLPTSPGGRLALGVGVSAIVMQFGENSALGVGSSYALPMWLLLIGSYGQIKFDRSEASRSSRP